MREHGQVAVFFALLLPVLLALSAVVIGVGNWYTHARHLQTKADAGAFAGGGTWEFPCGPEIDTRIADSARLYAGPSNPQVGGVPNADVHSVLNGPLWYDDDSQPAPAEFTDPAGPVCNSMILDVKMTEDNSFPLASLMPLFPDIKRKARVQIEEAEGVQGVLPVAVRAPVPESAAAVFYDESSANGTILGVQYFVKDSGIAALPTGLQGWSTYNTNDPGYWAQFNPAESTGVVIAVSFRGVCDTNLPPDPAPPNNKYVKAPAPNCFEDEGFATVNALCNQGTSLQIVNCYEASGSWPTESVQEGLHFIHGYGATNVTNGPPLIRRAWLEPGSCPTNGYFYTHPNASCDATLRVEVDVGTVMEDPPGPPAQVVETRTPANIDVQWGMRRMDGSTACANFGAGCDLTVSGSGQILTYSGSVPLLANTRGNAIAIQIRVKDSTVLPNPGGCGPGTGFNNNCRWFHIGSGISSTSVNPVTNNSGIAVLRSPVQRGYRGNSRYSGSVQWIQLTQDENCDGNADMQDTTAGTALRDGCAGFLVDMGLKGGIAQSANEDPILFTDGIGSNQLGAVACNPGGQGQILIDGVINGCAPWYGRHPFDWTPPCPDPNSLFTTPNPGSPWNDGRWPPLRCIDTRQTSQANQYERGFKGRFFGNQMTNQCPGGPNGGPGYIKGRNYWDMDTSNGYIGVPPFGYKEGSHDTHFPEGDPRIVTIFQVTPDAFVAAPNKTYPIAGFIQIYVTGFGKISGNGNLQIDDPCPGSAPPSNLDTSGGNSGGFAIWGHIINYVIPDPGATPSGRMCSPGASPQPCVAVLVE